MNQATKKTQEMVKLALFAGIIVVLAMTPLGYLPLGVLRPTTIHIPVILGSILLGWKKGAALGGLFGLTSLLVNTFTPNPTSFVFSPFYSLGETGGNGWSLVICFVPRILVGVAPYFVYKGQHAAGDEHDLPLLWGKLGCGQRDCSGCDLCYYLGHHCDQRHPGGNRSSADYGGSR